MPRKRRNAVDPDASCDDRELRSGACAVATACLEEVVAEGSEARGMRHPGSPLRPRATDAAPAALKVAYFKSSQSGRDEHAFAGASSRGRVPDGGRCSSPRRTSGPSTQLVLQAGNSAGVLYVTVLRHPLPARESVRREQLGTGTRPRTATRRPGAPSSTARARSWRRRLCGNQISAALNRRVVLPAIDRHLLDGVAMSVPHRSTRIIGVHPSHG